MLVIKVPRPTPLFVRDQITAVVAVVGIEPAFFECIGSTVSTLMPMDYEEGRVVCISQLFYTHLCDIVM